MSFALSGIATGMNTSMVVQQLMSLESMPQMRLQQRSQETGDRVSALQGLNTRLSSVADAAKKITKDEAIAATKGSSSDESVTVTARENATPASLTMRVDRLATGQSNVLSNEHVSQLPVPPTFTLAVGNELHTIEPASGSMKDVAEAINSAKELGLNAVMVRAGAGDTYVLQITGKPGTENAFTLSATGADGHEVVLADAGNAQRHAHDAQITLTDLGRTLTSSTNTFTDLMPGVDVSVSKVSDGGAEAATITVARNEEAAAKAAKGLVDGLGVVFNEIRSRSATSTKMEDGRSVTKMGLLTADSMVRGMQNSLSNALSYPVGGKSPAQYGIVLGRDGSFTFDETKFTEALKADPQGTNDFMTKLSSRVQDTVEGYTDRVNGQLTTRIKSEQTNQRSLDDQVAQWDVRLDNRRTTLERQFAAMETAIAGMQGQQQWLMGQLASLPQWS